MSVASHLAVSPSGYDRRIRQYLPFYDELIAEAARALGYSLRPARLIVDLGVGTAALSRSCLDQVSTGARSAELSPADNRPDEITPETAVSQLSEHTSCRPARGARAEDGLAMMCASQRKRDLS